MITKFFKSVIDISFCNCAWWFRSTNVKKKNESINYFSKTVKCMYVYCYFCMYFVECYYLSYFWATSGTSISFRINKVLSYLILFTFKSTQSFFFLMASWKLRMRWTTRWPIGCLCSTPRPRPCWRRWATPPPSLFQRYVGQIPDHIRPRAAGKVVHSF